MSVCLNVCMRVVCMSVCVYVCMSVCLYICTCVCMYIMRLYSSSDPHGCNQVGASCRFVGPLLAVQPKGIKWYLCVPFRCYSYHDAIRIRGCPDALPPRTQPPLQTVRYQIASGTQGIGSSQTTLVVHQNVSVLYRFAPPTPSPPK